MIIANPLYDVVFKYLLEDMDIVRELLSAFLGEEIIAVELKPQETLAENAKRGPGWKARYRFSARNTGRKIFISWISKAMQTIHWSKKWSTV